MRQHFLPFADGVNRSTNIVVCLRLVEQLHRKMRIIVEDISGYAKRDVD